MSYFDLTEVETKDPSELLNFISVQIVYGEMNIATCMNPEIGIWLGNVFQPEGGTGSDPLWAIEHIPETGTHGKFRLYRGDDIDGTEENSVYDADEVVDALIKAFHNYKTHFPDHQTTVDEILKLMPQYREKLRT